MKSQILRRFTLVIAVYIAMAGCTQEFIEPYRVDPNNLSGEAFWEDPELARGVVNSCYVVLMSRGLWGRMYLQPLVLMAKESDDLYLKHSFWNEFNTNNLTANNERIRLHYTEFYAIIRDANDFITNYPSIKTSERFRQNDIDDWLGQAYFMRAYAHFNLVCLFGEDYPAYNPEALAVPLVLSVPKTEAELYPKRATVKDIYAQIESDYKKAIELIPDDIRDESEYGRVGRMAVHGYLGKAYLWQQKYTEAIDEFQKIISSNLFILVDTMQHVYDGEHEFGPESIWELNYSTKSVGIANSYDGGTLHQITLIFSPRLGWPNLYVPNHAIARFGSDPRLSESIAKQGDVVAGKVMTGRDRPFTRKFITTSRVSGDREPGWVSNIVLLRLSDICLLYAECQNALGNDSEALKYVNMVRKRAYFIDRNTPDDQVDDAIAYKNLTGIALRDTIREERWRELFHEGHRWFDIQRWKILEEEIAKVPGQITNAGPVVYQSQAYYFPIPLVEIKANPNLIPSTKY
jgi:starch-binding outer membrane protein, SusD/RagB family